VRDFPARHKHRVAWCTGRLVFDGDVLTFVSTSHTFRLTRGDLALHEDGVEDAGGRRWHFYVEGQDVRELLRSWLRE
jgi:hypothetical protein